MKLKSEKLKVKRIVFFCFLFLISHSLFPQKLPKQEKPTTRILFVFDASFSMFGQWQSGMKMDIAKNLLMDFLDSLKYVDHIELALRVYGHQSRLNPPGGYPPNHANRDCQDTKLEVPFGNNNILAIKNKLKSIVPRGTTPIAYSLEQCANDFPDCPNCRNIVILITDGIEECDGDPCAVSLALQKKGIILKPFVIGIGLDVQFADAFKCVGKYYNATSEIGFKTILNVVISQALNNTTAQVNLLDVAGNPTETDVNMTFYDDFSRAIKYNYMHTINNRGNPDTIVIDPLGTYRMVVHTIPPVEKSNITFTPGKHNIIAVDAPQGYLYLKVAGGDFKPVQCIVRKSGQMQTLNVQQFNQTEKYIIGKYDLEILTLPRIYLPNTDVSQSKTTTVEIPQSGNLTILKPSEGPGSLYVEEKNKLTWVYNLRENLTQETLVLQPGRYRIEYRPKNSKESIYTIERQFKIESGSSTQVKLF